MMNDPRFLRAPTILAAFHQAGQQVAAITTKDKLRLLLAHGWQGASISPSKKRTKPNWPPTASPTSST